MNSNSKKLLTKFGYFYLGLIILFMPASFMGYWNDLKIPVIVIFIAGHLNIFYSVYFKKEKKKTAPVKV